MGRDWQPRDIRTMIERLDQAEAEGPRAYARQLRREPTWAAQARWLHHAGGHMYDALADVANQWGRAGFADWTRAAGTAHDPATRFTPPGTHPASAPAPPETDWADATIVEGHDGDNRRILATLGWRQDTTPAPIQTTPQTQPPRLVRLDHPAAHAIGTRQDAPGIWTIPAPTAPPPPVPPALPPRPARDTAPATWDPARTDPAAPPTAIPAPNGPAMAAI